MLETVLLSCAWGFGLLLLVPLVIALEVARPGPGTIVLRADGRLLGGLIGVRLHNGPPGWCVYPVLFLIPLPFLTIALARTKPSDPGRGEHPTRSEKTEIEGDGKRSGDKDDKTAKAKEADDGVGIVKRTAGLLRFSSLILSPGLQLLRALVGAPSLSRLRIEGRLGMGDPSLTGVAYGLLEGLGGALNREGGFLIEVTPEFRRKEATGRVHLTLRLCLAYLLVVVLRFGVQVGWQWSVRRLASLRRFTQLSSR